ncbi:cytochrome bd-I ubiquinol oxidase subunit 2 apoprotein (EC 1.10.3.10) [Streptoalloteichus tenebrarius]|uniref:Cytochrome bd-I ubiquinol oxidase subunit 2 apoprotein n=1 Tax=Streptoalloteichus tenebrarius (strain ATCC 17920 / DSM 40477 / JCM 4838 / CBS 697.72 / NBRC 16177 / NCIMB 11028 / NRRL B-12390 / A12253. 1 / ISP 5477) TaxID=1933 RepID=A0ABT1I445_STRSD|nr:cytochrome d ubiquinol oxidase subunit II [Streptoalloteichus tenebrarius]MCP2262576.1 cytochrome bd-I ubiquinol oxidase subunit 2 apoprotein (EC 1.10.3.10) [Streptoalloteichus tenebrarius]BFF01832.1 cytochrome d ubiquinol oxidase subunit II [Streptoalloteichus tenebrarius]
MDLATFWFIVIAVLWLGYLFLEGFDFGVGMLLPVLARDETERRVMVNTIGPVWDGNEVWLLVAGGATFAAFPGWYASLFSTAYLPLLLVLLALIGRGVAFEYRGKVDSPRWRATWDRVIMFGSWVPAFGVGLVLSANVLGLPLDAHGDRVGSPLVMVRWETLLGALALVGFCLVHGAAFVALKTEGDIRERARRLAVRIAPVALAPLVALLLVVQLRAGEGWTWVPLGVALLAAGAALVQLARVREGWGFAFLGVAVAAAVTTLFGALYPDVLPSTVDPANSLTVHGAASSPYTLTVMTWVAAFGTPAVLVYQGWTYWVFRRRIGTRHIPPVHVP